MSKIDVNFDQFWAPFWSLLGRLLGAKLAPISEQKSIKNRPARPDRPKTVQEHPKSAPRAPQESPREPKRHPKGTQEHPKDAQKHPKGTQEHPKGTQEPKRAKMAVQAMQAAACDCFGFVSVWVALGCSGCFCFGRLGLKIDRCGRPWACLIELIRCNLPWAFVCELDRRFPFSTAQVSRSKSAQSLNQRRKWRRVP